jgi:hypothetical protein
MSGNCRPRQLSQTAFWEVDEWPAEWAKNRHSGRITGKPETTNYDSAQILVGVTPEDKERRKEFFLAVLPVLERSVKVQQGGRFQHNRRTDQTGTRHAQGAQSCDETIGWTEIRRSLMGSIQDQKLMFDEDGFRDHGADAARAQKPGNRSEDMNEKHEEMAHHGIVARTANAGNYGEN